MSSKRGVGNDGFKPVKSTANKKSSNGKAVPKAPAKTECEEDSKCARSDCTKYHTVPMCSKYADCDNQSCLKRHRFIWEESLKVCSAGRQNWCTVQNCQYHHDKPFCTNYTTCSILNCTFRHSRYRQLHRGYTSTIIGSWKRDENADVEKLRTFLADRKEHELRDDDHDGDQNGKVPDVHGSINSPIGEVVVALIASESTEYSMGGDKDLQDTALSCKLISIPQQIGSKGRKKVLSITVYTPTIVDHGIELGKLTSSTIARASRLYELHHFYKKQVNIFDVWANSLALSTKRGTSAIAATKYYDVIINKVEGVDTVCITGESTYQPQHPLRIANVKLSDIITFTECDRIVRRSMLSTGTNFKLPSECGMECSIILAGALAAWWCVKPEGRGNVSKASSAGATPFAQFNTEPMVLSISYFGFNKLKDDLGCKVQGLCENVFGSLCVQHTDPTRTARVCETVLPTAGQLRQLQAIAGGMPESSTYKEVATRLNELGYAVEDVARSVGCNASVKHLRMSECPERGPLPCTNPIRSFISFYNQFAVLDTIDPNSPAAAKRKALFNTLPPLTDLLVPWTTKRNSLRVSIHKCNAAITQCMSKLAPSTVVPVQAVVVCPPKDGFMSVNGYIKVHVPCVTDPSCLLSSPVIIHVPARCARDRDGKKPTYAFDTSLCGVGRTVILMVSLGILADLSNGTTVDDGSVTLVPEVPLHFLPGKYSTP